MEVIAQANSVRISPRKARLVADTVRNLSIDDALTALMVLKKRGAFPIEKTLRSALANALNKDLKEENLFIKTIDVLEGPAFKRYHASTRGRIHPYKKRSSHIKIVLAEKVAKSVSKPVKKAEVKTEEISNIKSQISNKNEKLKSEKQEKGEVVK